MSKRKLSILLSSLLLIFTGLLFIHSQMSEMATERAVFGVTRTTQLVDPLMEAAKTDNISRLKLIKKTCSKYGLGHYKSSSNASKFKYPPAPQYSVFYFNVPDQLSYCPLYKAGSSTWLFNFCILGGETVESMRNKKEQLSTTARRLYPEMEYDQAKLVLEETKKLMVVRHPFERLLSAYRDKLENINAGWEHGTAHFYKKYGAKIVDKYRRKGKKLLDVLTPGSYVWDKRKPQPSGIEPSFREFVKYLIDTDLLNYADDHWIPYNLFCTPCLVQYDFVSKVETLGRDQLFVIRETGLEHAIVPIWEHSSGPVNASKEFISRAYYGQLTPKEIGLLYEKFRLDFEMFDYSPDKYFRYAKD